MRKILTVVIAAYNEQKNMNELLTSLLLQENSEFNIILVNDGSTDETPKIAESFITRFAEKNIGFEIISIKNSGLSVARNTAIPSIKTEYFAFIDGDDTVKPNYTKVIISELSKYMKIDDKSTYLDVLKINLEKYTSKREKIAENETKKFAKDSGRSIFLKLCFEDLLSYMPCLFVIRKEFWDKEKFKFPAGMYHEDFAVIPKVCIKANNMVALTEPLYNYIYWPGSITRTTDITKIMKKADDVLKIYETSKAELERLEKTGFLTSKEKELFLQFYTIGVIEKAKEIKKVSNESRKTKLEEYKKEYFKKIDKLKLYKNIRIPKYKAILKRIFLRCYFKS